MAIQNRMPPTLVAALDRHAAKGRLAMTAPGGSCAERAQARDRGPAAAMASPGGRTPR